MTSTKRDDAKGYDNILLVAVTERYDVDEAFAGHT